MTAGAAGATPPRPKLLYLITEDWFFCSHFAERAVAARDAGYEVIVLARDWPAEASLDWARGRGRGTHAPPA